MLPFTPEQSLGVFVNYNDVIWPIQIAAYMLGLSRFRHFFGEHELLIVSSLGFWPRCGCGPVLPITRFHSP